MNRKIKKSRAIEYVILCYAALLMLLFGPLGVLDKTQVLTGTEQTEGQTRPVGADERLQQVFIGNGGYLEKIGIYAENDLSRRVINLSISDDQGEVVFSRNVALDTYQAPGFFVVPVEFQTEPGRGYVWQISHPETEVVLGWQSTALSGLSCYGNYYYMDADQQISEQVGQNIPMQFYYADPMSFARKCGILAGIALLAAFLILVVENEARKRHSTKEVKVQWVFRAVGNPVIAAGAAVWLAAVLFYDYYGGVRADKLVYCAGILIPAVLLLYVVNAKRDSIAPFFAALRTDFADRAMDALQSLFWAGALWGCMDYVNAMYNIYQEYAYRKVLIFLGLALLTMCRRKYLFHVGNLIWLAVSGLAGWYVQRTIPQDAQTAELVRLDAVLVVVAGLVLGQLVVLFVKKRIDWRALSLPYTALVALLFLLIVIFRNTRGWPIYLAAAFALVYVFFLGWEGRSRFLGIVCNGIILNFLCALVFAVCRRPFRAWLFYRYNFVFHTVTVTAAYLTLVLCALFVKLLMQYHRSRKLYTYWHTALLFGMAASLLALTLSRTGYLAAVVMGIAALLYVSLFCYRERAAYFFRKLGTLVLILLLSFPVTYSAVRLIPPLYDDPYIFELEGMEEEWAVHKGDRADSENYITFPRFAYCFDVKLFGDEHSILRKFVDTFMASAKNGPEWEGPEPVSMGEARGVLADGDAGKEKCLTAADTGLLLASAGGESLSAVEAVLEEAAALADGTASGEETALAEQRDSGQENSSQEEISDYSNGRMDIFSRYIAQWNATGHDGMGVELEDGSLSVHAHNTYLQVIHDHGLITGAVYLLLGLVTLIQMFRYAAFHLRREGQKEKDPYAALPLAIFLAYAVAGLVEWLFHPCNPLGFATLLILAPLLTFTCRKQK